MAKEQDKTLSGLQTAIQMEIDGKAFYLKASAESGNELGKKLLAQLAAEEDTHRKVFERIYESIKARSAWPDVALHHDEGRGLKTMFAEAADELGRQIKPAATELDAVQGAIDMEVKSYDYYQNQLKRAAYDGEREFYAALSAQERQHQLVLLDYQEYLQNPAGWFVKTEHHSLDGG